MVSWANDRRRRMAAACTALVIVWSSAGVPARADTTTSPSSPATTTSGASSSASAPTSAPQAQPAGVSAADAPVPVLGLTVTVAADGTPTWDVDDTAGNDSGPSNGIVRVNDTVTYRVQYSVNGATGVGTTFAITFPKGMEITALPGYCTGTGSSISPATAGALTLPLTDASITQLAQQTLTCNVGARTNASDSVLVTVTVLNVAGHGRVLTPVSASIRADGAATVTASSLPSVTTSARLMWDVSIDSTAKTANTGTVWGPAQRQCAWDATQLCFMTRYPLLVGANPAAKGAMPTTGTMAFTLDLSPRALYPGLTEAQYQTLEADPSKYGARASTATSGKGNSYPEPASKLPSPAVATDYARSVRDSGTATYPKDGTGYSPAGQAVTVTLSGVDTSLRTYPTTNGDGLQAIPTQVAYAVSMYVYVYVPATVAQTVGTVASGATTLSTKAAVTAFTATGLGGAQETLASQPTWNDYRTLAVTIKPSGGFDTWFTGVPGQKGNMTPADFYSTWAAWEGLPGGAVHRSGAITVSPQQTVMAGMLLQGPAISDVSGFTTIGCDSWDSTKLQLRAGSYPASTVAGMQYIGSGGAAVWISGYEGSAWAKTASAVPTYHVQYSAVVGGSGAASTCTNSQGPWYDDPSLVPGNDATLAAAGIYTAVSRVRVWVSFPTPTISLFDSRERAWVSIGLRVVDNGTLHTGDALGLWGSAEWSYTPKSPDDMLADTTLAFSTSSYVPATHAGSPGDRLVAALAQVRVDEQVRKGTTGVFSTVAPQVTGGDTVQLQLSPTLTNTALAAGILKDVWVESCLPASLSYASATVTPSVVSLGSTPGDAKRTACAAGETYVRWVLASQEVNTPITPVVVTTQVSATASDGASTSSVQVWATDDTSAAAQRVAAAGVVVANIAGLKLETTALTPVVQVNVSGQTVTELNRWQVRLSNTLPSGASAVTDADVIAVLPALQLAHVTLTGGSGRVLYTSSSAVADDPADPSNASGGATTWCDAAVGGAVVSGTGTCPVSAAEVTAVRVQQPGTSAGAPLTFEVAMLATGNAAGDTYTVRTSGRAAGLTFRVGPVSRSETVVSSSIGDRVWWDLNQDGAQDVFRGDNELGAAGVTVRLSGVDDLGNAVSRTTTTAADGSYQFAGLRSSSAAGYVVTFVAPSTTTSFSAHHTGLDAGVDSNADPVTGVATVVLAANTADGGVDAGLVANGGIVVTKSLRGAGVLAFGADDTFTFDVACAFNGATILAKTVTLAAKAQATITSDELGGLPAYTQCVVTETAAGHADTSAPPAPVTVTVPWTTAGSGVVTASLTNYYSAGSVVVSSVLTGDSARLAAVANRTFSVLVTCQVTDHGVTADVYSGTVTIQGGQRLAATDARGVTVALPIGARCFAEETDAQGADEVTVDHDTAATAVQVAAGTAGALQTVMITVTNHFAAEPEVRSAEVTITSSLAGTGGPALGVGELGASVLLVGLALVAASRVGRRRRRA